MNDGLKKFVDALVWKDGLQWRFRSNFYRRRGQAVKAAEKEYRSFRK